MLQCRKHELAVVRACTLRGASEGLAQLVLGAIKRMAPARRQILTGPVDVECQHRHGGLERRALASAAALSGALQRFCDILGLPLVEYARLEIQRVAGFCNLRRPALGAASAACLSFFCPAFGPFLRGRHRRFTIATGFILIELVRNQLENGPSGARFLCGTVYCGTRRRRVTLNCAAGPKRSGVRHEIRTSIPSQ